MKFKYAIGEIVQLKLSPDVKVFLLERHSQECAAGVQLLYYGRPGTEYGMIQKQELFREFELEKDKSKAGGTE